MLEIHICKNVSIYMLADHFNVCLNVTDGFFINYLLLVLKLLCLLHMLYSVIHIGHLLKQLHRMILND